MKLYCLSFVLFLLSTLVYGQTPTPSDKFDCPNWDDGIFPDPNDCSKYFVCTNGLAWHEDCAPGLLFDPTILECNWPHLVQCFVTGPTTRPTQPPSTWMPSTTTGAPVTGTGSTMPTSSPQPTTAPPPPSTTQGGGFVCPRPDGNFPDPFDCSKYHVCINGHPTTYQCPDGLWWDNDLQVCNWPDAVRCDLKH